MTWTLHHGDCLEWLATLPDKSVDHVIADFPYSAHVHGKSRAGARKTPLLDGNGRMSQCAISREVDFGFGHLTGRLRRGVAREVARVVRRWCLFFCDVESSHLWRRSIEAVGLDYCRTGAWIKIGATPQFTGDRPGVGFEAIVVGHPPGRKRWHGGGSLGVWSHLTAIDRGSPSGTAERVHPTQKPHTLLMELIELFTDPGDTVMDPCCGSGTTGLAALRLGRHFIGCELDAKYHALATERLTAESRGLTLAAHRMGQEPLFKEGA